MSPHSVFCIATSHFQANHIVDQLKIANIDNDRISALLADQSASLDFCCGATQQSQEAAVDGVGTTALIGVAWGWIAGIGALAIPGAGKFIATGPIIAAMSGATMGATFGSVCSGLIVMGMPELDAKRYEGKILKGNILLSVHTENSRDTLRVTDIFNRAEAVDISAIGKPVAAPARGRFEYAV